MYFITVFEGLEINSKGQAVVLNKKVMGYQNSRDAARNRIKKNAHDQIHRGKYKFAVIEKITNMSTTLCPVDFEGLFVWNELKGEFESAGSYTGPEYVPENWYELLSEKEEEGGAIAFDDYNT